MSLIYILFIIGLIYVIWKVCFAVKLPLQTLNFVSGGLGSGKTLTIVDMALKLRRKSILMHYLTRIIPIKKIRDKWKIREIYSNFPIKINNKEWSTPLLKEHLLCDIRLSERCIVVLDEASTMFPNSNKKSDDKVIYSIRWFRHFTNGSLIMADQSIGDIDIAVRRRVNQVYALSNFKKLIPFILGKSDVSKIEYSEDTNLMNVADINNFKKRYILHFFGKKHYDSRYMSKFYNPTSNEFKEKWSDYKINPLKEEVI